ncbi:hypothetical protein DevBK_20815 [Devosia sp. BK]|uniref:hypothetical protein n=1 Tax=Devosia sp. BK TaxID=2871706 RepID=UPI00293A04D5|nr:hypothetical protein [Devosia sp. BK]MDV3253790.1 hypothetical protein [Devosia sp. BK]
MRPLSIAGLSAAETIFRLICALIAVRLISAFGGVVGVANYGQFQNLLSVATIIGNGAVVVGLVTFVSRHDRSERQRAYWVQAGFGAALSCGLLAGVVIGALSLLPAAEQVVNPTGDLNLLILPLLAPVVSLYYYRVAILNGSGKIYELIASKAFYSISLVVVTFVLLVMGLSSGAEWGLALAPCIALALSIAISQIRSSKRGVLPVPKLRRYAVRRLTPYWIMGVIGACCTPITLIAIRLTVADKLGWHAAGIWEAAWRLTDIYLLVITNALIVYYVPRLSKIRDLIEERDFVVKTVVISVLISSFLALGFFIFQGLVVDIIYGNGFSDIYYILWMNIVASIIRVGGWVVSYNIIARGKKTQFILMELGSSGVLYLANLVFVEHFGLIGAGYASIFGAIVYGLACVSYFCLTFLKRQGSRHAVS